MAKVRVELAHGYTQYNGLAKLYTFHSTFSIIHL